MHRDPPSHPDSDCCNLAVRSTLGAHAPHSAATLDSVCRDAKARTRSDGNFFQSANMGDHIEWLREWNDRIADKLSGSVPGNASASVHFHDDAAISRQILRLGSPSDRENGFMFKQEHSSRLLPGDDPLMDGSLQFQSRLVVNQSAAEVNPSDRQDLICNFGHGTTVRRRRNQRPSNHNCAVTTAVFLHGVGGAGPSWRTGGWDRGLRESVAASRPDLADGFATVSVDFDDLMDQPGKIRRLAAGERPRPIGGQADQDAIDMYDRRRHELRAVVGGGADWAAEPRISWPCFLPGEMMVRLPFLDMRQAGHYRHNLQVQEQVLDRISQTINELEDDVVLIAHSLGSVVGLDMVHLRDVKIGMFLTLGSPMGVDKVWGERWQSDGYFPYERIGGWLNLINLRDPIPWQRGLANRFPQAVDVFVRAGDGFRGANNFHDPATYTRCLPIGLAMIDYLDRVAPVDS